MIGTTMEGLTLQPKTDEWKAIEKRIRVERAKRKCERCGVPDNSYEQRNGKLIKLKLKVIRLDGDASNNVDWNLRCLCQECKPIVIEAEQQIRDAEQSGRTRLF